MSWKQWKKAHFFFLWFGCTFMSHLLPTSNTLAISDWIARVTTNGVVNLFILSRITSHFLIDPLSQTLILLSSPIIVWKATKDRVELSGVPCGTPMFIQNSSDVIYHFITVDLLGFFLFTYLFCGKIFIVHFIIEIYPALIFLVF